jgi:mevalonate kinase
MTPPPPISSSAAVAVTGVAAVAPSLSTTSASAEDKDSKHEQEQVEEQQSSKIHYSTSAVLQAIQVPEDFALGTVRLSCGRYSTKSDIETVAIELLTIVYGMWMRKGTIPYDQNRGISISISELVAQSIERAATNSSYPSFK